jgi:hypothetical protein
MSSPAFLITIDTEGDDLWSRPSAPKTKNAAYLPRFQALCESHGFRPTWLTNNEMIEDAYFREFAHDVLDRNVGEIGMHIHAWDSPPIQPLTADDARAHPYLVEYPEPVMRDKIRVLTAKLEDELRTKMVSHRAGRWGFDARYARILIEEGYLVDCSVTPRVSWRDKPGAPEGQGGPDYRGFPDEPYWLDPSDISRSGASPLLEVPVTIGDSRPPALRAAASRLASAPPVFAAPARLGTRVLNRLRPSIVWLRPTGRNRQHMLRLVRAVARTKTCAMFMLHSSEFMPGGSPTFRSQTSIEALYDDLGALFSEVTRLGFNGLTMAEFRDVFAEMNPPSRQK